MDLEELKNTYADLEDRQLVDLHQAGGLTEPAYQLVEAEMLSRSIPVNPRPEPINEKPSPPFFSSHWKGEKPLWSAFWLVGGLGMGAIGFVFGIILNASEYFISESYQKALVGYPVLFTYSFYGVFAFVSILRCSKNTKYRIFGALAQLMAFFGLLGVAIFIVGLVGESLVKVFR